MAQRFGPKKPHNALKHGVYSAMGLLPGENPAEFGDLRKSVFDELAPQGPLEEDIVSTIVRLLWRKQNLLTIRTAEWAKQQRNRIIEEEVSRRGIPDEFFMPSFDTNKEARAEAARAGDEQAQHELGAYYELTQGDIATSDRLIAELQVEERLDAAIEKCVKRLLMLRGVKSMSMPSSQPAHPPKPRSVPLPAA
jgi:hypothetical protein